MNIYETKTMGERLLGNAYAGRGIVIGKTEDGKNAAVAYFIMGRSENSRNRVFTLKDEVLYTEPYDVTKVKDPSLIIYAALRKYENKLVVTNGDQTDTVYEYLKAGKCFGSALATRDFEPDAPNFTPRISGMLTFGEGDFTYEMSILKSIDEKGSATARHLFSYPAQNGLGHFIHTYVKDGNPLPTFQGEPERVSIPSDMEVFAKDIWESLDEENKISLYVRYTSLADGSYKDICINKNQA